MAPVITLAEHVHLPSWILIVSLSFCVAFVWVYLRAPNWKLPQSAALDITLAMAVGAVLGGRLLHVGFEAPDFYRANPGALFKVWDGGFVFYGGLLGSLLGAWIWCRKRAVPLLRWLDFIAPVIALSYALGRVGCFLNGCCFGRQCDLPWAVRFPIHESWGLEVIARHPTQLYASAFESLTLIMLLSLEPKLRTRTGQIFWLWLTLHGLGRFVMEWWRADDRGPLILGLSLGLVVSGLLILVGFLRLILIHKHPSMD